MRFTVENLGTIQKADLDVGKLTIICGKNNTGKTYFSYALYSHLKFLRNRDISNGIINSSQFYNESEKLKKEGKIVISLQNHVEAYNQRINDFLKENKSELLSLLSFGENRHPQASFNLNFSEAEASEITNSAFTWSEALSSTCSLVFEKEMGSANLNVTKLGIGEENIETAHFSFALAVVVRYFFRKPLPRPFIITCERTGISMFKTDFLESWKPKPQSPLKPDSVRPEHYPQAIQKEIEYLVTLHGSDEKSHIHQSHREILNSFSGLLGGDYKFTENNTLKFVTKEAPDGLFLKESSSTVRTLVTLGSYLDKKADTNDLLMIDEPELNLHPANQRKMARLLAQLVNAGIRVFLTTHSDYLIKEFNTLLMLKNSNNPRRSELQTKYGYHDSELLNAEDVKVYEAVNHGLDAMSVTQAEGIEVKSFDVEIIEMGKMQQDILFGIRRF